MVAGCELHSTEEVDQEWDEWYRKCRETWDVKAAELSDDNYERIPDDYYGEVFRRAGVTYVLTRALGNTIWVKREVGKSNLSHKGE